MRILAWPAVNPGNPYAALLYANVPGARIADFSPRAGLRGRFDVWHLHWPELVAHRGSLITVFGKLFAFVVMIKRARWNGTAIVWTVHNLRSHATRHTRVERIWMWWFTRRVDGIIALSASGLGAALSRYPCLHNVPTAIIPHGHYIGAYPNKIARSEARERLNLPDDCPTAVFVGRISPYKGVDRLIDAFRAIEGDSYRLIIAGSPASVVERERLIALSNDDPRISTLFQSVRDKDLQLFLNAADLVVLPYDEILNSGSALLALSFLKPVLVPNVGAMPDLARVFGDEWVRRYSTLSPETLRTEIDAAANRELAPASLVRTLKAQAGWDVIGNKTSRFYEAVLSA